MSEYISKTRRKLLQGLVASPLVAVPLPRAMAAETLGSRPIRLVVPFPAGATTDYVARVIAQYLGQKLNLTVVVDNVAGAAGNIGASTVARSVPDGHTILLAPSSYAINPMLYPSLGFKQADLSPLGVAVNIDLVTVVRRDLPVSDVKGLIAMARAGKEINFGSPGVGTIAHLGLEVLAKEGGCKFTHVPYKGSQPAIADLIGGNIDVLIDTAVASVPLVQSGKIKAIAAHSKSRLSMLPNVRTYAEQGFNSMTFQSWNTFMLPTAVPKAVADALAEGLRYAIAQPQVKQSLREKAMGASVTSPEAYKTFMNAEAERWGNVIRANNIKD